MVFNADQFSLDIWWNFSLSDNRIEYRDVIIDRKSKYTVVAYRVNNLEEIKKNFKLLSKDNYFRKASHNTYAYRIIQKNGSVIEWKNDDWESWAGMCVLRELQRENATWIMLVVTRYFGWIQLHSDRFKNVINTCKIFFEKEKKK